METRYNRSRFEDFLWFKLRLLTVRSIRVFEKISAKRRNDRLEFLCEVARSLCHAADRPVCMAFTSEPDMFLGVALVCPVFLNLLEQTCMRNCVLVCSAGNDSDCWCVPWFRVRAGVAKHFSLAGTVGSPFFAVSTSRLRYHSQTRLGKWASSSCACLHHDKSAYHDVDDDGDDDE